MWIKFKKFDENLKEFVQKTHVFYVCPVLINQVPCSKVMRNDYPTVRFHACKLKKKTLLHFQHTTIPHSLSAVEQHIIHESQELQKQRCLTGTADPDDELLNAVVDVVGKCNISFSSFTSPEFRHFLELVVSRVMPVDSSLPSSLFSSLHYRNLVNIILLVAKRRQSEMLAQLDDASVTLMMDGGTIGNEKITALTLLIHQQNRPAFFWRFEQHCSSEAEYKQLAEELITELHDQHIYVVSVCTDGLPIQRSAMMNLCTPSGILTRPFHIYCANHLVNLIIEHSCQTNPILQETAKQLNTISTTTRVYSIRTLIGQRCPAWVETRWYTLQNVISFVLRNEVSLLQNRVILPEDLLRIQKFNILFSPLFELHALFETGATRLCDVFPAVMNAVRDLFSLAQTNVFQNRWRYAVRTIIFYFIHYFFEGTQSNLFRLAYVFHPLGADTLHRTLFRFQTSSGFPIPALTQKNAIATTIINKKYTPAELAKQFRVKQVSDATVNAGTNTDQSIRAASSLDLDSPSTVSEPISSSSNSSSRPSSSANPQTFFMPNSDRDAGTSSISSSSFGSPSSSSLPSIQTVSKQPSDTTADDSTAILSIRYGSSLLSKLLKK